MSLTEDSERRWIDYEQYADSEEVPVPESSVCNELNLPHPRVIQIPSHLGGQQSMRDYDGGAKVDALSLAMVNWRLENWSDSDWSRFARKTR